MRRWTLAAAIVVTAWSLVTAAADAADNDPTSVTAAGSWTLMGSSIVPAAIASQGLTTVTSGPGSVLVTRGNGSVAPDLAAHGWTHIGDPGSVDGSVLDAYQSHRSVGAKLFTLTTASGVRSDYLHRLVPGEMSNNSFAAVAPGGRWFVSGEWGTMTRLLVFATPAATARTPGVERSLPLATTITLTGRVRDVQGCSFASPTSLICSTNDPTGDLYAVPRQLLTVQLARPLDGRPVTGVPRLLGAVPWQTACEGGPAGEVEGIDVHGRRMVVAVNTGCDGTTELFSYTDGPHGAAAGLGGNQTGARTLRIAGRQSILTPFAASAPR
jgi:hypothetical protein